MNVTCFTFISFSLTTYQCVARWGIFIKDVKVILTQNVFFLKIFFELINKRQWICFMVIFAFFHKCLFFIFLKLNTIFILRLMTLYWFSPPAKKKTRPYTWQHQSRAVGQEHWGKLNCFLQSNFRPTDRHTDMVTYALD